MIILCIVMHYIYLTCYISISLYFCIYLSICLSIIYYCHLIYFNGVLKPANTGSWELTDQFLGVLQAGQGYIGSLKMAMARLFKSWKLANYTNQGFSFLLESQLLNNLPIYHSKFRKGTSYIFQFTMEEIINFIKYQCKKKFLA